MFDTKFLKRANNAAILEYLSVLAKTYTPEWHADFSRPDAGASLAKLFSHMLAGNAMRAGRLPEKISAQLVDMLDIQPLPARPARSAVRFSAVGADRVFLPRGTKLSAKSPNGETLVFETLHSITVVSAEIGRVMFSQAGCGKIFYAGNQNAITLYGNAKGTFPDSVLTLEHPYLFRVKKDFELRLSFDGANPEKLIALADPRGFRWTLANEVGDEYETNAEFLADKGCLRLTAGNAGTEKAYECVFVRCKALCPVMDEIGATGVYIDTRAENIEPEQIWRDDVLQENVRFYPFGERLSLLCELKIACDEVLTQKGADVTMRFRLEYKKFSDAVTEEMKRQYKLVMKADKPEPPPLNVFAQEVSLECWNGTGWKPVKTNPAVMRIFAGETAGEIELAFTCPKDIAPIHIGAAERNWLRLRLIRADGCYLANTVHCAPVISNMRFSYKYKQKSQRPECVRVLKEMRESDITARLNGNKYSEMFSCLSIDGDRLMIGFDSKPNGETVNVYFDIEKASEPIWMEAEYSSAAGFRKLHLNDYTCGLSRSSAVSFSAPQDFSPAQIYGENLYWVFLRLSPRDEVAQEIKIRGIYLNTVHAAGKRTADAEIFYTDELITENELRLSLGDLLYTEVWIDEKSSLGESEKTKLREESRERILEERGSGGELLHFWVRWDEVRDFRVCKPNDRCYKLDRSSGTVRFSDGVHGRKPPSEESCAVKIIPASSSGVRGNVPKNSITQPLEQLDFIGAIENISDAYGGHDAQKPEELLKYACSYIRSGNRVVTSEDMIDAIRFSCGEIAKLKLICDNGIITILFLPYDFENASRLFSQTEEHIRRVLSDSWQESQHNLRIMLPDFAEAIVEADVFSNGDALNEEEAVCRRLNDFLHPITGGFGHTGWEIGVLPQREQILSVIQSTLPKTKVEMLRISVRNRTSGEYFSLRDVADAQNLAMVPGKYDLKWRRRAGTSYA